MAELNHLINRFFSNIGEGEESPNTHPTSIL